MDLATNKGIFGQAYRQGRADAAAIWKPKIQKAENELIELRAKIKNSKIEAINPFMEAEEKKRIFFIMLYGWYQQVDIQLVADIALISLEETQLWFEYLKLNFDSQKGFTSEQLVELLKKDKTKDVTLSEAQVTQTLKLLNKSLG
jgi:hypothetical protein